MKRKVGVPFYAYQKSCRLQRAAVKLKFAPQLKLREIATACGFYDEFHLNKVVKQKYGVSPQEYRRQKNTRLKSLSSRQHFERNPENITEGNMMKRSTAALNRLSADACCAML